MRRSKIGKLVYNFLFSAEESCIPYHMSIFQIQCGVLPGDLPAPHAWYGDLLPADGAPSLAGGQGDHGSYSSSICFAKKQAE